MASKVSKWTKGFPPSPSNITPPLPSPLSYITSPPPPIPLYFLSLPSYYLPPQYYLPPNITFPPPSYITSPPLLQNMLQTGVLRLDQSKSGFLGFISHLAWLLPWLLLLLRERSHHACCLCQCKGYHVPLSM